MDQYAAIGIVLGVIYFTIIIVSALAVSRAENHDHA
jgi:hypothetical protein